MLREFIEHFFVLFNCSICSTFFLVFAIVAFTQIPEAMTGAMIAGVSPVLALQSTWLMNIFTALIGGRPGMISGTTPFIGIALADLVQNEGPEYIFYAVMFAGVLQVVFGVMGLGALMRFVPYPVVQGFSNAMAIYIIAAQFRFGRKGANFNTVDGRQLVEAGHSWAHITDENAEWNTGSPLIILGIHAAVAFLICLFLPKLTRVVPSSFVALSFCTIVEHAFIRASSDYGSPRIKDYGEVKTVSLEPIWTMSDLTLPDFNFSTFRKVYLYGLAVFGTGLCETLLATHIIDELTEVKGRKNRVAVGQGVANLISAAFGGMGGSGSIAQSIVVNHSDGITNLCTFLAGIFILLFIYAAFPFVHVVPVGAIAGIMIWGVSYSFAFEFNLISSKPLSFTKSFSCRPTNWLIGNPYFKPFQLSSLFASVTD